MASSPELQFQQALRRAAVAIDALHNAYLGLDEDAQRTRPSVLALQKAMAEAQAQAHQTSRAARFAGLRDQGMTLEEIGAAESPPISRQRVSEILAPGAKRPPPTRRPGVPSDDSLARQIKALLREERFTVAEICRQVGCADQAVRHHAKSLGITPLRVEDRNREKKDNG
jgi:hypothetical protein